LSLDNRLSTEVGGVIDRFADELIAIFRAVELDELIALRSVSREEERAVSPQTSAGTRPATATRRVASARGARSRSWPGCSADGCSGKMYPPSGANRLCYRHHLAAGGEPSPLLRGRKKAAAPEPAPPPLSARPRTILRKKKDPKESEEPARKREKPTPPPKPPQLEDVGKPPPGSHRDKALDEADKLFNFDGED